MSADHYLLDTNVLLHWLRASSVCATIDGQFKLTASGFRPMVCEVSLGGEILPLLLERSASVPPASGIGILPMMSGRHRLEADATFDAGKMPALLCCAKSVKA